MFLFVPLGVLSLPLARSLPRPASSLPLLGVLVGGRLPLSPAPSGGGCRLRRALPWWAAFFLLFFSFFLAWCFLFSYLCPWFSVLSVAVPLFSSASAVVAACGFSSLRCLFAGFVVGIPAGRASSPSVRVAAACPAFAGALVGRGLCSWWVAWSVASLVASSWGVSVGSGGVPAPGVQLSLFS